MNSPSVLCFNTLGELDDAHALMLSLTGSRDSLSNLLCLGHMRSYAEGERIIWILSVWKISLHYQAP
jgi:hypothetical protein